MEHNFRRFVVAALLIAGLSPALAQVPNYTLPSQTVVGRSGIGSGPAEAIPISRLRNLISSVVTTSISGASTIYNTGQNGAYIARSNSGVAMTDTVPGTGTGVLPQGTLISVKNDDTSALLAIVSGSGATLDGSASGYVLLGPKQSATLYSDGSNYRSIDAPARAKMSATLATTLYVATTSGSDNNPCILSTAPCATLQGAADKAYQRLDLGEGQLSIQALTPGTFTAGVYLRGRPPGLGNPSNADPFYHAIQFRGDPTTPSNFVVNVASGACFSAINSTTYAIDGFKLICNTNGVFAGAGSILGIEHIEYGAVSNAHVIADGNSYIHFDNSYTISGGAAYHMLASDNSYIISNGAAQTVTLTGTPAFSTAFVGAQSGGLVNTVGFSYSGAGTGVRWATGPYGGAINNTIGTACDSIFPGNAAGSNSGGGQCDTGDTTYSGVTLSGLTANSFVRLDSAKKFASFATANNGVLVTDGSGVPSISTTLPTGLALQTPASGNGSNLTALNATQLTSGTVPAARMPALTGACTTSAGAVATTCQTNSNFPLGAGTASAFAGNVTNYAGFGAICASANESNCNVPISSTTTIRNLYVTSPTAPGGSDTYVMTVRKNNAATTITCTITGAAKTCNDTTHTASYVAGDTIDIQMVSSATAASSTGITFGMQQLTTSP